MNRHIDDTQLINEYVNKKHTLHQVAKNLDVNYRTVIRHLKKFGIARRRSGPVVIDLSNKSFGSFTVIRRIANSRRQAIWLCKCLCGNEKQVRGTDLRLGLSKSCGKCRNHCKYKNLNDLSGSYWLRIQHLAKDRNKPFGITMQYAWNLFVQQAKKCAITGIDITLSTKWNVYGTASLDRIDSKKGYIDGNVQWVHKIVNRLKSDFSEEELFRWSTLIAGGPLKNKLQ